MIGKELRKVYLLLYKKYAEKRESKQRVNYLRKIGVKIGDGCRIDTIRFSTEPYLITIGDKVAVSGGTRFITHDGAIRIFKPELPGGIFGKIVIKDNVFIGNDCIICPNTTVGENTIVGAGSVVRGTIPPNSVVTGNPAQVISRTSAVKFFFKKSQGRIQTDGLSREEKDKLVKKKLI